MQASTALQLTPLVPVIAVFLAVTGGWRMPPGEGAPRAERADRVGTVLFTLEPQRPAGRFPWEAELVGLTTAMLEGGLSSLESVTARVEGAPVAPGLDVATAIDQVWTGSLSMDGVPTQLTAELVACPPFGPCRVLRAEGTQADLDALARELATEVARLLERPPERAWTWTVRQSPDSYAQLVAGRSAAVFYGLLPPADPSLRGDVQRDAIARAPWLDPKMPIAQWVAARRSLADGDALAAERALRRGVEFSPGTALQVAHGAVLTQLGSTTEARETWASLRTSLGDDPRLEFADIEAQLEDGNPEEARRRLDALPHETQDAPRALALRVQIDREAGEPPSPDGLLLRWQELAPHDPEPVRQRVDALVAAARFDDALDLIPELAKRGRPDEARALEIALAAELGDWERSAAAAERVDPHLADAIRQLSGTGTSGTGAREETLGSSVVVEQARSALTAGDLPGALLLVHRVLRAEPENIEALQLQIEVYEKKGSVDARDRSRCALHHVHPGAQGDPTSSDALALTRRCEAR